jgi:hypothetical protein
MWSITLSSILMRIHLQSFLCSQYFCLVSGFTWTLCTSALSVQWLVHHKKLHSIQYIFCLFHWSMAWCSCTRSCRVGPVMTFIYMYQPPIAPTHKISSALCYARLIIYEWVSNSEFVPIAFWVQWDNCRCSHWKT